MVNSAGFLNFGVDSLICMQFSIDNDNNNNNKIQCYD